MDEMTSGELRAQRADLLPARETLWMGGLDLDLDATLAAVSAQNVSQAVNAVTEASDATSVAEQTIDIAQ